MSKYEFFTVNCGCTTGASDNERESEMLSEKEREMLDYFKARFEREGSQVRVLSANDPARMMVPLDPCALIRANGDEAKAREIQRQERADWPRPMPAVLNVSIPLASDSKSRGMIPPEVGDVIRANAKGGR